MADPIIETRNLTRRFGRLTAVDRLALEVPPAGVYGFLGPNGAGKTTTIRLLLGLIRPDEGTVRLFGRDLRGERAKLLGRVGALVESPSLYKHLSGRENLEVARRMLGLEKSRVDDALNVLGMERDACRKVGY
jgi:ABC-type multidrug transport system ATPase subunit